MNNTFTSNAPSGEEVNKSHLAAVLQILKKYNLKVQMFGILTNYFQVCNFRTQKNYSKRKPI